MSINPIHLRNLEDNARRFGVTIHVYPTNYDSGLILSKIFVHPDYRSVGNGNIVINQIMNYCDVYNLNLYLTPSNSWGANLSRLKKWYKRLGFVKNKDFAVSELLVRLPTKS